MVVKVESSHIDIDERIQGCINDSKREQRSLGNRRRKRRHVPHKDRPLQFVQQRNYRERTRVYAINDALEELRHRLPVSLTGSKLSKTDILRKASEYINELRCVINCDINCEDGSADSHTRPTCTTNGVGNRNQYDSGIADSLNSATDRGHCIADNRLSPTFLAVSDDVLLRIQMTPISESSAQLPYYSVLEHQNSHNATLDIQDTNVQLFSEQPDPKSMSNLEHTNMIPNFIESVTGNQLWTDNCDFSPFMNSPCVCEDCIYHGRVFGENNSSDKLIQSLHRFNGHNNVLN